MWRAGRPFGNEFRARDGNDRLEGEYIRLDLAKTADGFGAVAFTADTPGALRSALEQARSESRTCVIVCETEKFRNLPPSEVWWDVAPSEASEDTIVQKIRAEYERDRAELQRFYY
jgi:3D-(3,5/4)-trihydroxycyclohexane-1,2-dione acylhydrolase (decyclizing)